MSRPGIEVEVLLGVGGDLARRRQQQRDVREQRRARRTRCRARAREHRSRRVASSGHGRCSQPELRSVERARHGWRRRSIASAASTSRVPRAVAAQVNRAACSRAPAAEPVAQRGVGEHGVDARPRSSSRPSASSPVRPSSTASTCPAIAGDDRGRAARRGLGERSCPNPRAPRRSRAARPGGRGRRARRRSRRPGRLDPALGAGLVDLGLELVAPVALAHDHRLERPDARGLSATQRVDQQRRSASPARAGRPRRRAASGDFSPPGREPRVDARRHDVHAGRSGSRGRRPARASTSPTA